MNYFTIGKWVGVAVIFVGLIAAVNIYRNSAKVAKAELNIVKIQLANTEGKFEDQKRSTDEALLDVARITKERNDNIKNYENALSSERESTARYRKLLNKCVTPQAVAERLGSIFPVVKP